MTNYSRMSREELISRLQSLEAGPSTPSPQLLTPPIDPPKPYIFGTNPTRHIALLITYHGWPYSGLAIQGSTSSTTFPTVEGELLKALEKTRLIESGKGWDGCEFSRCGRTDRGVSGHGQVVDLWIKSSRKKGDGGSDLSEIDWREPVITKTEDPHIEEEASNTDPNPKRSNKTPKPPAPASELPYPKLLNAVLPPSIKVLAWSPLPSTREFDSRFSCTSRHYKYAFHLYPTPSSDALNLTLMEDGAKRLIGEHDFRNFCKLDGSKQILSHARRVTDVWFDMVPSDTSDVSSGTDGNGAPRKNPMIIFNLIGTAFLWHQVRHIIALLFLIGAKHEPPSLITDLLNTELHPAKPTYQMGDPLPLTLHECGFPEGTLDWRYGSYDGVYQSLPLDQKEKVKSEAERGREILEKDLESMNQEIELRSWQVSGALRKVYQIYSTPGNESEKKTTVITPLGGGNSLISKRFLPVLRRPVGDTPEVTNRKWMENAGERKRLRKEAEADAVIVAVAEAEADEMTK